MRKQKAPLALRQMRERLRIFNETGAAPPPKPVDPEWSGTPFCYVCESRIRRIVTGRKIGSLWICETCDYTK